MRSIPFEEAAQNFAAILDAAENGENTLITRDGIPFARFVSERAVSARAAELMERYPRISKEAAEDLARTIEQNRPMDYPDAVERPD